MNGKKLDKINPVSKYFLTLFSMFRTNIRDYGMYIALFVIFLIFTIITGGNFLGARNFTNLFNQTAYVAVLAVGMTLVIVTRQIDLSVGFLGAFLGAFVVVAVENGGYAWLVSIFSFNETLQQFAIVIPVLLVALVLTILVGTVKGFFVAKIKVPSFVVTLAGMFIFKGLLYIKTNNRTIPTSNNFFNAIGVGYLDEINFFGLFKISYQVFTPILFLFLAVIVVYMFISKRKKNNELGIENEDLSIGCTKTAFLILVIAFMGYRLTQFKGISWLLFITVLVVVVYHFITTRTVLGRRIYAVGGNPEAAELSGISVEKTLIIVFISMGILALVSGVMYASYVQNTSPNHGPFWELYAIASAYIGGTSAEGGVGKVVNAVIGAIVMMSLKNGMALAAVSANIEPIVLGSVLLLSVVFDIYTRNVRPIDYVGIHYAKKIYRDDYDDAYKAYLDAQEGLKTAQESNKDVVAHELALSDAKTALNKVKDKIRVSKTEDFTDLVDL